jgi:hypothetical protein
MAGRDHEYLTEVEWLNELLERSFERDTEDDPSESPRSKRKLTVKYIIDLEKKLQDQQQHNLALHNRI